MKNKFLLRFSGTERNLEPIEYEFERARFQKKAAIEPELVFAATNALVANGDSLPLLRKLPAHSVSLILTDPPYHATKKRNIYGDTSFAEDQHYLEWMIASRSRIGLSVNNAPDGECLADGKFI